MSDFIASDGMLSDPTGFPPLICPIDFLVTSMVGGVASIERYEGTALMFSEFGVSGLFENSSVFHPPVVIGFPSFPLTGLYGLLYLPARFFVVSCGCLIFHPLAVFSTIIASSYTYFCLSALMLLFNILFGSV
ncbi:unnamed protein product [Schistosoma rodhaini]|uniref:Uncharacterized protein n=1 Tax=Schistosoma rodhaini TaxID=6188 RepID=A0AA85EVF0_9TREM|nr:unnamed protein product [Schistosoma rodhaini]CAH8661732.1 unnamed protein product [Schistosoma rodhaini]